ncbi:MAG: GNAT family N-acetyltransferase [Planctomycetota bacterium]|nr:MAG: GNAT family N-acetyltransferase [Planctomycetota bacterium]
MNENDVIKLIEKQIPKKDYIRLIEDVGWKKYINYKAVGPALKATIWSAVAKDNKANLIVGAVRIVGDGAIFYYIQDLMVLKKYRKRGIGTALMECANNYLTKSTPEKSFTGLFTHVSNNKLYEKFGFNSSKNGLNGMHKYND